MANLIQGPTTTIHRMTRSFFVGGVSACVSSSSVAETHMFSCTQCKKVAFFFSHYIQKEKRICTSQQKQVSFFASFVQERNRAVKLLKQFDPVPQFQFDDEGLKSKMRWFRGKTPNASVESKGN